MLVVLEKKSHYYGIAGVIQPKTNTIHKKSTLAKMNGDFSRRKNPTRLQYHKGPVTLENVEKGPVGRSSDQPF